MANVFDSFLQGQQAAQMQKINQLKMQQMADMAPIEKQLAEMKVQQSQQNISEQPLIQRQRELSIQKSEEDADANRAIIVGNIAAQALGAEDEITKQSIISMGMERFGLEGDPSEVTDSDLLAWQAQGAASKTTGNITEYQAQNLELQKHRLGLEQRRLTQADDRLGLQVNKLETSINAALQEALAAAKSRGKEFGKDDAAKTIGAPKAYEVANNTMDTIDFLLNHPGMEKAVGFEGLIRPENYIVGSSEYDFALKLKQLEGKAFLQAYENLKGSGQITEVEGKKATEAIAQLSRRQSREQFVNSLNELKGIAGAGRGNALKNMGGQSSPTQPTVKRIRISQSGERL